MCFHKRTINESCNICEKVCEINDEEINTIMHSRKSLLFINVDMCMKKKGDLGFDVKMGSFDGAEICELVCLYILHIFG